MDRRQVDELHGADPGVDVVVDVPLIRRQRRPSHTLCRDHLDPVIHELPYGERSRVEVDTILDVAARRPGLVPGLTLRGPVEALAAAIRKGYPPFPTTVFPLVRGAGVVCGSAASRSRLLIYHG